MAEREHGSRQEHYNLPSAPGQRVMQRAENPAAQCGLDAPRSPACSRGTPHRDRGWRPSRSPRIDVAATHAHILGFREARHVNTEVSTFTRLDGLFSGEGLQTDVTLERDVLI